MKEFRIIIPANVKPLPKEFEITAAELLSDFFKSDVEFLPRHNIKTPDFLINNVIWELKSPTGDGKRNIQHNLQDAYQQSKNIVFDARRSKIYPPIKIERELTRQFNLSHGIKRVLLIKKSGKIIEIKR